MKRNIDTRATAIAAGVGLTLSLAAATTVARWDREVQQDEFANISRDYVAVFRWKLRETLSVFSSLAAFYAASQEVEPDEFEAFGARLLRAQPTVEALAWLPRIPDDGFDEIGKHLPRAAAGRLGVRSGSADTDAGPPLSGHFPIAQVVPTLAHEKLIDFDCTMYDECASALRRAYDTGVLALSGSISLPIGTESAERIIALSPIYANGTPTEAIHLKTVQPLGFVAVILEVATAWTHAAAHLRPADIDTEILDITLDEHPTLLHRRAADGRSNPVARDRRNKHKRTLRNMG
jgi:CHASE1-domain containing sensor protein